MTLRAVTPAPMAELLDLYTSNGLGKPINVKAAILQAARSESIGFYDGDRLVAAALLYPLDAERVGEELRELAFACVPDVAPHLVSLIHTARLTRSALVNTGPVRIRARVRLHHKPGQRLAILCGLQRVRIEGWFEIWEFEGSRDDRICSRGEDPLQRP